MTKAAAAIPASTKKLFSTTVKYFMAAKIENQNGNERPQDKNKDENSESLLIDHPTFEEWLRTLESCPGLLASECREAKNALSFHQTKTALDHWRAAGFPSPEQPPAEWRNQVWAYTQRWSDSQIISKTKANQSKVPITT